MKRLILSMAAMAALFFTACEKEEALSPETFATIEAKQIATNNITTEEINLVEALATDPNPAELGKKKKFNVDSLSATILTYIKNNYAAFTPKSAFKDKEGNIYVIVKDAAGNSKILIFDKNGNFIKESTTKVHGGGVSAADSAAVATIKTYLKDKYADGSYSGIKKEKDGTYTVVVKTKDGKSVIITFDKEGKFVKETAITTGNSVTATIKAYLTDKYPDATYGDIKKEKDGTFTVVVKTKDGKSVIVTFDKEGKFVKQTAGPTTPTLPDAATTYIKTNYPTAKIIGNVSVDKDGNYTVTLLTDKGFVIILFDKDGKVLKEIKKK